MIFLAFLPLLFTACFAKLEHVDFPHLLIHLSKDTPNTPLGTHYTGEISNSVHTEISFDVPSNIPAAICRINFHINVSPTKRAPRTLSGDAPYKFFVSRLQPMINKDTDTWFSHPPVNGYVATVELAHDGTVDVQNGWFDCPKGDVAQFLLYPVGERVMNYTWYELNYPSSEGGPHGVTLEMHT